ncbi:hypothetical protein C789_2881 [Microcystis aeruginosa FACHB-905 = DIANCHI905]|uniref:Uncharacterized protein n=1 Tax=Microcystis aeruginosa PCC 7806SL TaxID=1903187 RepID=A0AB33C906_MICA7|nr:hypothetical protein BH695_5053 [Microcystis aeruginosa PCC 7806SL]ELS47320.1 hypothetical protein C789_2874 [Microcystis aeruginosa FACHB-905 = DIANCHI905]ELS47327.1 hypothetical protein C789_2881 [Microcystis aeruginosa FACHB-905 = DIANCHI905]
MGAKNYHIPRLSCIEFKLRIGNFSTNAQTNSPVNAYIQQYY